ncbi:hypothetical protein PLICRDRAFT_40304 [Plicaturopsis crispa FD-325 SS-3]|nr:hypothetical protein PLICRDRAFT_40304 [Plicaturopsis crispa FD-325 SS-3]
MVAMHVSAVTAEKPMAIGMSNPLTLPSIPLLDFQSTSLHRYSPPSPRSPSCTCTARRGGCRSRTSCQRRISSCRPTCGCGTSPA